MRICNPHNRTVNLPLAVFDCVFALLKTRTAVISNINAANFDIFLSNDRYAVSYKIWWSNSSSVTQYHSRKQRWIRGIQRRKITSVLARIFYISWNIQLFRLTLDREQTKELGNVGSVCTQIWKRSRKAWKYCWFCEKVWNKISLANVSNNVLFTRKNLFAITQVLLKQGRFHGNPRLCLLWKVKDYVWQYVLKYVAMESR